MKSIQTQKDTDKKKSEKKKEKEQRNTLETRWIMKGPP